MRLVVAGLVIAGLTFTASPALAQKKRGPGKPTPDRVTEQCKEFSGDELEGCTIVGKYLDLWKKKNWGQLKKLQHPKTQEKIARVKQNIGEEAHAMAPWYWAKDTYVLHDYRVKSVVPSAQGTITVHTTEHSYRIEEDGIAEDEPASYLAGRYQGKWYVVERRGGGGEFNDTAIEVGMKGYFDTPPAEEKPAEAAQTEAL